MPGANLLPRYENHKYLNNVKHPLGVPIQPRLRTIGLTYHPHVCVCVCVCVCVSVSAHMH